MKNSGQIISGTSEFDDPSHLPGNGTDTQKRTLVLQAVHHGRRLDHVLVELVPEFSRHYLQQLVDSGAVCLNGKPLSKAAYRVRMSDHICIELRPTPQTQAFKAEQLALDVVYADDHLLVINKPAGLVVHPAPGHWSGTLMNALLGLDDHAFALPRAGIVHRLDKDTSGLMVVARKRSVMDALVQAMAAREVQRQYVALAHGAWHGPVQRVVDAPIGRDPVHRLRMAVLDETRHTAKAARTDIVHLQSGDNGCLVQCTLHTGRTHQIRVHLASIKHPLVSDILYGGHLTAGMHRQALHAYRLAFMHPVSQQIMVFRADLPLDMAGALDDWRLNYNLNQI